MLKNMKKTKDTIHCRIRYPPSLVIRCNFEDPLLDWPLPQIEPVQFFRWGRLWGRGVKNSPAQEMEKTWYLFWLMEARKKNGCIFGVL